MITYSIYTFPLLASLIICLAFFNDYKDKTYKYLSYYHPNKINYMILLRWGIYTSLFCVGSFISGIFYYRNIAFLDMTSFLLSIRFIPNILFLSSFILCTTVLTKNSYNGLFITLTYFILDLLSTGRLFKLFSIGANSANFHYTISPQYYLMNRVLLCLCSIIFLFLASDKNVFNRQ